MKKNEVIGYIQSGCIDSTSDIITFQVQLNREDTYKEHVTAYYIRGEIKTSMRVTYEEYIKREFDDYDLAVIEPCEPFGERKITYHAKRFMMLPKRTKSNSKRMKRMKEVLGWNFLDPKGDYDEN
jgi:hypothetical protein